MGRATSFTPRFSQKTKRKQETSCQSGVKLVIQPYKSQSTNFDILLNNTKEQSSYQANNFNTGYSQNGYQQQTQNHGGYESQKPPRNAFNNNTGYNQGRRRPPSRSEIQQARNSLQLLKTQIQDDSDDSDDYNQNTYQQPRQQRRQNQNQNHQQQAPQYGGYQQQQRNDNYHFQDKAQYQPIHQQKPEPQVQTQDIYQDSNTNYRRKFKPVFNNNYDQEEKTRFMTRTPVTNYDSSDYNQPKKKSYKSNRQQEKRPAWNNDFNDLGVEQEEEEDVFSQPKYQPKQRKPKKDYYDKYSEENQEDQYQPPKQKQRRQPKQKRPQYEDDNSGYNQPKPRNGYNSNKYKPKQQKKVDDAYEQEMRTSQEKYYNRKPPKQRQRQQPKFQKQQSDETGENRGLDVGQNEFNQQLMEEEQSGPVRLRMCSQGCGRKFAIDRIKKHESICRKTKKGPRKVFNATEKRLPKEALQKAKYGGFDSKQPKKRRKRNPKWKMQSNGLRAAMKAGRGGKMSKKDELAMDMMHGEENTNMPCPHCGRTFNEQAGKRHIPFCAKKHQYPAQNKRRPNKRRR